MMFVINVIPGNVCGILLVLVGLFSDRPAQERTMLVQYGATLLTLTNLICWLAAYTTLTE